MFDLLAQAEGAESVNWFLESQSEEGGSDQIRLSDKLAKRLKEIYSELNAQLRKELEETQK